jgi:hypothetical protein
LETVIVIITGKTALFEQLSSLEDPPRFDPGFTSLHFATAIHLQGKVVGLASKTQPGGPGLYIYLPYWQGGQFIPPKHRLPFT